MLVFLNALGIELFKVDSSPLLSIECLSPFRGTGFGQKLQVSSKCARVTDKMPK